MSYSTDGGAPGRTPSATETAGDRGYYSAIAISPHGTDAYLVYNAFTTPFRNDTTSPRALVGVVKHADIGADGALGAWTELHRGAPGDPRTSSQNNLWIEFLGDYVYAVATNTYGAGVWNDVRNGADCPAIDTWRAAAQVAIAERHRRAADACAAAGLPGHLRQHGHLRRLLRRPDAVRRNRRNAQPRSTAPLMELPERVREGPLRFGGPSRL